MDQEFTNHPSWQITNKLFYSEYHSSISFSFNYTPIHDGWIYELIQELAADYYMCPAILPGIDFRILPYWNGHQPRYSVFTNTTELIEMLMNYEQLDVHKLRTPMNEDHLELIQDGSVEVKNSLFYGKYKFKIFDTNELWLSRAVLLDDDDMNRLAEWISTLSKKKNLIHIERGPTQNHYLNYLTNRKEQLFRFPTIYTNDESILMMAKLMFSSDFDFKYIQAIIYQP